MNAKTEAIANADAQLSRAGLYTHSGVLNELRCVLEAVKAGVPETVGYGEIGKPAFAHGWSAAMEHVYGELAAARALLREIDGTEHASGELRCWRGPPAWRTRRIGGHFGRGALYPIAVGASCRLSGQLGCAGAQIPSRVRRGSDGREHGDTVTGNRTIRGVTRFPRNNASASR